MKRLLALILVLMLMCGAALAEAEKIEIEAPGETTEILLEEPEIEEETADAVEEAAEVVEEVADEVADVVEEAADEVAEAVGEAAEEAAEAVEKAVEEASEESDAAIEDPDDIVVDPEAPEEVPEAEPATFDEFADRVNEFLESIDLSQSDIALIGTAMGAGAELRLGTQENVVNVALSVDGQPVGSWQMDSEAIYTAIMNQVYGIRLDTITKLFESLDASQLQGSILSQLQLPFDPQQLQADLTSLLPAFQAFAEKLIPAVVMQTEGPITTVTLDSEALAEGFTAGVDDLLADETVEAVLMRYLPLLDSNAPDMETIRAGWTEGREQVAALLQQVSMTYRENAMDSSFSLDYAFTTPEEFGTTESYTATVDGVMGRRARNVRLNGTLAAETGYDSNRIDFDFSLDRTSFRGGNATLDIMSFADGRVGSTLHGEGVLDMLGTPSYLYIAGSDDDGEDFCLRYANNRLTLTSGDSEILSVQYRNGKVIAYMGNAKYVGEISGIYTDHITLLVTATQYGQSTPIELTLSLADDALKLSLAVSGSEIASASLSALEKQAFDLLSAQEVIWITEEMISSLTQLISGM